MHEHDFDGDAWSLDTLAVRAGHVRSAEQEHSEPIFATSSFVYGSAAEAARKFAGEEPGNIYSRFTNPTVRVFESFAEAMVKLTNIVMAFAPFGVFGLIAHVAGNYGLDVLLPLAKVIGVAYLASVLHVLLVYSGLLALLGRLNPLRYLQGILDALVVAFSSASSSGTLPVSLRCAKNNLGVSEGVAGFVLPVGATINMDGTAIYQGVVAVFIAQLLGVDLSMADYGMIIVTGTLASIGTAGVPGAGLVMLSIVMAQIGLPLEAIAVIAGIDRILDMARTSVNVAGDLMVTTLVGKSEGELDESVYNARHKS